MSAEKGYNGWSNYETWNLALWLGNEEGSYTYWQERTQSAYDDTDENDTRDARIESAAQTLADELKTDIEDGTPTVTGFYADILNAALSEVNYYEIAESWLEDIA